MRKISVVLLLIMLSTFGLSSLQAQSSAGDSCPNTFGTHYQYGIFPNYGVRTGILSLRSLTTGEDTQIIETFSATDFDFVTWTSDCRYFIARVDNSFIAWDVVNNTRQGAILGAVDVDLVSMDDSGEYLLVPIVDNGVYLWHISSGTVNSLNTLNVCDFWQWEVDEARNEFIAVQKAYYGCAAVYEDNVVQVIDIATGNRTETYTAPDAVRYAQFSISENGQFMLVNGFRNGLLYVFDRVNNSGIILDLPDQYGLNNPASRMHISNDGNFVAIGNTAVRVWDLRHLENLAALRASLQNDDEPVYHNPHFRFDGPNGNIRNLKFVDGDTIEVRDTDGLRTRWNIFTGTQEPLPGSVLLPSPTPLPTIPVVAPPTVEPTELPRKTG